MQKTVLWPRQSRGLTGSDPRKDLAFLLVMSNWSIGFAGLLIFAPMGSSLQRVSREEG
ncbi:hypothetical protein AOQ84DRAFT_353266 [Glonium stellatum]|uniref:Uncharacterized protein n=1 Tax=Glonium stellatum TaxID=574774 RepID=A0A8E2JVQ9_9PEZI|nr:hypothetical protein AOQ84DRAFT_353266 [Glonium stellatum]